MKGHVRKRGTTWSYVVDVGGTGPRQQKWRGGFRTRKEAEVALRQALTVLDQGGDPFPRDISLSDYLARWLDYQARRVRANTHKRETDLLRLHKTDRARRQVTLPGFAVERLKRHRKEQAALRLALGFWHAGESVCDLGGELIDPDAFSRAFKTAAANAGLPAMMRLHDVRHGVATAWLQQGLHPAIASAALGHASPAFTMSVYQHVVDGMSDQAAAALEAAFDAAGRQR